MNFLTRMPTLLHLLGLIAAEILINQTVSNIQKDYERVKRDGSLTVDLHVTSDDIYYAEVDFGTPTQRFRLILDTGSDVNWVESINSVGDRPGSYGKYDASVSSSYTDLCYNFTVIYKIGRVFGYAGEETLQIGGAILGNFQFGEAINVSLSIPLNLDGILGLSYDLYDTQSRETLLDAMISRNVIAKPVFALDYSRIGIRKGRIIFGNAAQESMSGNPVYETLTFNGWVINSTAMAVGERLIRFHEQVPVLMDTGSAYIHAPERLVEYIHSKIPYLSLEPNGWYLVDCSLVDTFPHIRVYFKASSLRLTGRDYVVEKPPYDGTVCMSGFVSSVGADDLVFGVSFLRNFCTVFDKDRKRIGFLRRRC